MRRGKDYVESRCDDGEVFVVFPIAARCIERAGLLQGFVATS